MSKLPWHWLMLALVLGLTAIAYLPGLTGGFMFDDFVNLDALGKTGPIDTWAAFWRYLTSGDADPVGRPISLLSFLLDAQDWPADPAAFLRTNLCIHLLNGVLLFSLLLQLGRALSGEDRLAWSTALVGAGLWMLHPLMVSTTLYVVQREAMLPATFILSGLLMYGAGRRRFVQSLGRRGMVLMAAGIVVGTSLACLSKANGILLPLLCLTLEATVWRQAGAEGMPDGAKRRLRMLQRILLVVPSLVVVAYLASFLPLLPQTMAGRTWTVGQRLLTEPRVLVDYLHLLAVPRSVSSGIYNDAYPVSTGLLEPWTTLPSALLVIAGILGCFAFRIQLPRFAAGILFFFAAQALESTVVPLELYFEHRNYLPSMLLFWPFAHLLLSARIKPLFRTVAAGGLLLLFSATTYQRAKLWGDPEALSALWALQNPQSSRAQATAGVALADAGDFSRAIAVLGDVWKHNPADFQIGFNYIDVKCRSAGIGPREKASISFALATSKSSQEVAYRWLEAGIGVATSGRCPGMHLEDVAGWIAAMQRNPLGGTPSSRLQTFEPLLARVALARHQPLEALRHFNAALSASISPDLAARDVSALAGAGYYREALAHLDYFGSLRSQIGQPRPGMPTLHAWVLETQGYWDHELGVLRMKLVHAIENERAKQP